MFFALGLGSAWAATELSRNEVKSKHIGKGQVKTSDLASDAVNSAKVDNGTLLDEDFVGGPTSSPRERVGAAYAATTNRSLPKGAE